jgi:ATP-dependent DNA ligase
MRLPSGLEMPPRVALARSVERIPEPGALPGGCRYEPKRDGYRAALVHDGTEVRLLSRRGTDLSARFPEIIAALTDQLRSASVLDGELVIWSGSRLDFDALQERLALGARNAIIAARQRPASLVVFDVLALDGDDVRPRPFDERRSLLERLGMGWRPPLNLSPVTSEPSQAREWFETYGVAGLEGLVVKGGAQPYAGGSRDWLKVKRREVLDVVCAAVTGAIDAPRELVAGLPLGDELRIVGRTSILSPAARRMLVPWLRQPMGEHPWPQRISSGVFGRFNADRSKSVELTRVQPVVVEVSADAAWSGTAFRHALRFVRVRPDAEVSSVRPPPGRAG